MNKKALVIVLGPIIILLFFIPSIFSGPYILHVCILIAINIILSASLRFINLTGEISLAHGGMMTVGAYTSTLLVMKLGVSSWLALAAAGFGTAIFACLIGFPFVRLKGIYFAMVTILLGQMVTLFVKQWSGLTGGTNGIFNIPRPDPIIIPGLINITFDSRSSFYFLILIIMLVSLTLLYVMERSRLGLIFRGIQQSDSLAESVGVNTIGYRVLAFSIGCFFAGLTGGFYSQYVSTINPGTFGFLFTVYIIIYMVVGGSKSFFGPIVGAFVLGIIPEITRPLETYQPYFFAGMLMLTIFFVPEGLVGVPRRIKMVVSRLFRSRKQYA
jgi:branched-chain amino acid transport system permease protein